MQVTQVYCLERVYEDLRKPLVVKDVVRQLIHLDNIVTDVFERLTLKINAEKERAQVIDGKIAICQSKVNAITDRGSSNKPTTVFSTAKYPAPKVLPANKSLYFDKRYEEQPPLVQEPEATHFVPAEPITSGQRAQLTAEVFDLFERVNMYKEIKKAEVNMAEEGLGRLPEHVPSVGNVLLFNTGENPYQEYTSWDNLLGIDIEEVEKQEKELAAAPYTVVHGDKQMELKLEKMTFTPQMGALEDLSTKLPSSLPLAGIADYSYQSNTISSIAPSMYQANNNNVNPNILPELPQISEFSVGPTALQPHESATASIGPVESNLIPPPPPPSFNSDSSNVIPPPPPPSFTNDGDFPPPPPPATDSEAGDDGMPLPPPSPPAMKQDEPPPPEPKNPRANLLDAIRSAGLTKLRKVQDQDTTQADKQAPAAASVPTNPMEEMKQKLLRRQAALSGKQDRTEQKKEKQVLKSVEVVTATELPTSNTSTHLKSVKKLPTLALSDDGSDDSNEQSTTNDENDFLAQIKNIKKKQEAEGTYTKPATTTTKEHKPQEQSHVEPTTPISQGFESHMLGLSTLNRPRQGSLSLSEASEWSDD